MSNYCNLMVLPNDLIIQLMRDRIILRNNYAVQTVKKFIACPFCELDQFIQSYHHLDDL